MLAVEKRKTAVESQNISRAYDKKYVLQDINLKIKKGEIFALLGPNGSGKTTFFKILMRLINPEKGRIFIDGKDIRTAKVMHKISYQGEMYRLYDYMTPRGIIELAASFYQNSYPEWGFKLLEEYNIPPDKNIKTFSRGMKQITKVIQSLINRGEIIILDEPTTGLDFENQWKIWQLLIDLNDTGRTIIFSTHNFSEVEKMAERAALLKEGRLLAVKSVEELPKNSARIIFVPQSDLDEDIFEIEGVTGVEKKGSTYYIYFNKKQQEIISHLSSQPYFTLKVENPDLKDIFQIVGDEN
ncbi:MAG: ABC transporter ATP-binding protein [Halanaerobiales bacterium]